MLMLVLRDRRFSRNSVRSLVSLAFTTALLQDYRQI
jgi:hypothetical protein